MARIVAILQATEGTAIVTNTPDYIYAQCTTRLLKFTDDLEFAVDRSASVIQVRSASRLGQKDFDVNRNRVEAIREKFNSN